MSTPIRSGSVGTLAEAVNAIRGHAPRRSFHEAEAAPFVPSLAGPSRSTAARFLATAVAAPSAAALPVPRLFAAALLLPGAAGARLATVPPALLSPGYRPDGSTEASLPAIWPWPREGSTAGSGTARHWTLRRPRARPGARPAARPSWPRRAGPAAVPGRG